MAKDIIKKLERHPELLRQFAGLIRTAEELEERYSVPGHIFTKKITLLESTVKYLKENLNLNYKKIAELVNRDQRNIWQIYHSAKQKFPSKFTVKKSKFMIPVSILADKKFSALEAFVAYLKDNLGLSYHEIAILTKRDDRTIWTACHRHRKKSTRRRNVK
ncbi:hypothetical protein KY317_03385 [Candidatus Woesearchaeota archaeon]|nr:hypothetical protein [Candidatus Woesearchaeota archaeon]